MKRTILIEIILFLNIIVLICCSVALLWYANKLNLNIRSPMFVENNPYRETWIRNYYLYTTLGSLCIIFSVANLISMIVLAIRDFPVFKPFVDKLHAKRTARKETRCRAKAEQAAIAKQERIDQLKAELDELQKDE